MGQVELAALLREARAARGLSLRDVAEGAGTTVSYVHRLERGRVRRPGGDVLRRVAAALDLPASRVLRAAGFL
jgi:transcriptional regulator with XRE-family HTH domain